MTDLGGEGGGGVESPMKAIGYCCVCLGYGFLRCELLPSGRLPLGRSSQRTQRVWILSCLVQVRWWRGVDVDFGGHWLFVLGSRSEGRSRGHRGVCLFVIGVEIIGSNVLVCACA